MRRQIPLALARVAVSPVGPGLTSKTGLGLEREHQKCFFRGRFLWPGTRSKRRVGARGLGTAPEASLDGSRSVPRDLRTAPRAFQEASGRLQEAPRRFQEACRRPQERTMRLPDASKSTSGESQTLLEVSGPLREHPSRPRRKKRT